MKRANWRKIAAAAAATVCAAKAFGGGTSGTWSSTAPGVWSNTANWTNGIVANGQDGIADFSTLSLSGPNTVHLDSARTIGGLNFGDQNNGNGWTLDNNGNSSNVLTLSTSTAAAPVINVNNQSATISANLAGTQGFTLNGGPNGAGILTLSGANTYTGVATVASGTLVLSSSGSSNSLYTTGLSVDLDPTLSTVSTSNGVVTDISDLSSTGSNDASNSNGVGSVTLTAINGHKALSFSGSAGLVINNYSATTSPETVFAVVDPTSVSGPSAILGSYDGGNKGGLELRLYQNKLDALNASTADLGSSSSNVSAGVPSVVAYSFNSSTGSFYLNGSNIGAPSAAPVLTGTGKLTLGFKSTNSVGEYYSGALGTVLVYSGVLTAAQVASVSNYLTAEYAAPSGAPVNLASSSSNLSLAGGSQAVSSLAGVANSNVYLGGGVLTIGSDNTNTTFQGNISDSGTGAIGTGGQFIKVGSGTLTLTGSITNTGGTQVNAGTLSITGNDSTSGTTAVTGGNLTVTSAGTYAVSGATTVTGGTLTVAGIDSDSGAHTISGTSTTAGSMVISGTNNTSNSFTINNYGSLVLSGVGNNYGAISIGNGGLLTLAANIPNTSGTGSSATSSAIGSPSTLTYAGGGATTNVQLLSDTSVMFANSVPSGGTGSGAVINYYVNPATNASNQTLSLSSSSTNGVGYATYQTTINVLSSAGYTLAIPAITQAYSGYLTLNASTGNLSIPGGITSVGTLTVNGAVNTSIGTITGAGPLVKSGAGTLSLIASNAYTGATTISGGTLALGSAASLATSGITLSNAAKFDISADPAFALSSASATLSGSGTIVGSYNHTIGSLFAGTTSTVGTLNITGSLTLNSTATLDVTLNGSNNSTGGLANDLIAVTGGLNLVGNNLISLTPVTPTLPIGTTWTVLTYSGSAPTGTGTLNVSSSQFSVIEVPGAVELKYTSGVVSQDVWTGNSGSNWDTSTLNFVASGLSTPINFANGDAVIFNDTSSNTSVNLAQTLLPASVTVNSNNSNYTFSGTGSIGGSASLLKLGSSILTINSTNAYTGTTNVAGGTLVSAVSSGTGIGTGPLIIARGATLQLGDGSNTGSPASGNIIQNSSITDNGMIVIAERPDDAGTPVFPAGINGTGSVVVTSGVIGIGGTAAAGNGNNYSGGLMVVGSSPDLEAYEADSLGTGLVTVDITTTPGSPGSSLDLGYETFTYTNAFNLSGYALQTYGGGGTTTTISGPVNLFDQSSVMIDLYSNLVFTNNVTAANNQTLTIRNYYAQGDSVTFGGNVSTGTGNIQSGSKLIFAPPSATTITISTAGIEDFGHSAAVQQNGLGTTILDGSNSYSGGTTVTSGTLVFNAPNALPNFSALTIAGTGTAQAANYSTGSTKNTLFTSSLSIATGGKLDLGNNDLVVQSGSLTTISAAVASGYNSGKWNGSTGITSSAAAADTTHLHALGVILNTVDGSTPLYGSTYAAFDGATQSAATDVLVKYTYYGDTNLDGEVDGSDYSRIDASYLSEQTTHTAVTGWYNGDFNYDGVVNGSDYTLMDNAFNTQGAQIASEVATATDQIAGVPAGSSSVPEPASLGLLALAGAGLLGRRRR
jgi:autotransporter-associated beta strand protein